MEVRRPTRHTAPLLVAGLALVLATIPIPAAHAAPPAHRAAAEDQAAQQARTTAPGKVAERSHRARRADERPPAHAPARGRRGTAPPAHANAQRPAHAGATGRPAHAGTGAPPPHAEPQASPAARGSSTTPGSVTDPGGATEGTPPPPSGTTSSGGATGPGGTEDTPDLRDVETTTQPEAGSATPPGSAVPLDLRASLTAPPGPAASTAELPAPLAAIVLAPDAVAATVAALSRLATLDDLTALLGQLGRTLAQAGELVAGRPSHPLSLGVSALVLALLAAYLAVHRRLDRGGLPMRDPQLGTAGGDGDRVVL